MTGCTSNKPRQMDINKNRQNRKSNVPRIYNSRPPCTSNICEVDTDYLSTRSWYLPMDFFLEKWQDVLRHSLCSSTFCSDTGDV